MTTEMTELPARENDYLKESSFHCDGLRDRFIKLYLVLAGTALSEAVALAGSERPLLPEVLAILTAAPTHRQEVTYAFSLPEAAVITGLWLGES